jgi:small subunit ribosomal protein S18
VARNDKASKKAAKETTRRTKQKVCSFCAEGILWVDYKDVAVLRRFMSDRGKIRARRVTGNCAQHQRGVAVAIKTARELAMLPYTQRIATERAVRPRAVAEEFGEATVEDVLAETEELDSEVVSEDVEVPEDMEVEAAEFGEESDL